MKIYKLYIDEVGTLVILVDKDGDIQLVKYFDDSASSAIELCQDTIEKIAGTRLEMQTMTIEKFLLKHCRVFPEAS